MEKSMKPTYSPEQITVFYDGSCPLCPREIAVYRRCKGAQDIRWTDISRVEEAEVAPGVSKSEALARFHVIDEKGQVRSGAAAFAVIWRSLPSFRALARLQRMKGVMAVLELAYLAFLKLRPVLQSIVSRFDRS